jgi:protein involved in polysaccharide export with SLBB domain
VSHLKSFLSFIILTNIIVPSAILSQEQKKIQPGDAIQIVVHNYAELSQTVVVGQTGTVDFPFMQELPVEGMSLQRFREILMAQMSRYTEKSPLITVRFTETYPVKVTVLGQVARPGIYLVPNTLTLQGAIGQAGGFIPGAQLSQIKLIRGEGTNGANQVVNMEKFYLEGDPKSLPALKEDDTIVVPGNPMATSVKVLGSVVRPGSYEVFFRNSLLDVLFMAGGPTNDANMNNVKVLSPQGEKAKEARININELVKSNNLAAVPLVVPGDVVYVPQRPLTWRKFVGAVRDLSIFASLYLIIRYGRQ